MPVEPQKPYIASKEAAKKFGLSNDHIGLLCRRGKVQGLLWGRVWYVHEPSLVTYAKKNSEAREVRKRELSKQWRAAWAAVFLGVLFCGGAPHASADYVTVRLEPLHQPGPVEELTGNIRAEVARVEIPAPRNLQAAAIQANAAPAQIVFKIPDLVPLLYAGVLELGDITASVIEARSNPAQVTYLTPPEQDTRTHLAALVEANYFLSSANEEMFDLYVRSFAGVAAAVRFDIEQFAYVWDETFGAFGRYYVRDLSKLNDMQVLFYFATAQKIETAYNSFADETDAAITLDSSISVASVSLAPVTLPGGKVISNIVDGFGFFITDLFGGSPPTTTAQPGCGS